MLTQNKHDDTAEHREQRCESQYKVQDAQRNGRGEDETNSPEEEEFNSPHQKTKQALNDVAHVRDSFPHLMIYYHRCVFDTRA